MSFVRFLSLVFVFICTFNAYAMPERLASLVAEAGLLSATGTTPVVITDLDETLVDSTFRRLLSLRVAMNVHCRYLRNGDCGKLAGLNLEEFYRLENRYDPTSLFTAVGIPKSDWLDEVYKGSTNLYLSGNYLDLDQSVPGATEFIQALKAAGAQVFYVSSRWKDCQDTGTVRSLLDLGLITGTEYNRLILRPRDMSSIDFKRESFARIKKWADSNHGSVYLVMENEPENMNAMTELFPTANAIFVEGAALKPEPVKGSPIRLRSFR